jgi:hypothetical protein
MPDFSSTKIYPDFLPIFLNLSALAVAANFQPCNTL